MISWPILSINNDCLHHSYPLICGSKFFEGYNNSHLYPFQTYTVGQVDNILGGWGVFPRLAGARLVFVFGRRFNLFLCTQKKTNMFRQQE